MNRTISLVGRINKDGDMVISDKDLMTRYLKLNNNKDIIVTIQVFSRGSSDAIKGYYYNKIVPDFRKVIWDLGERKTEKETELFIRQLSPIAWREKIVNGKYILELREISELDNQEMVHFIQHLKEIAATDYQFYIYDYGE